MSLRKIYALDVEICLVSSHLVHFWNACVLKKNTIEKGVLYVFLSSSEKKSLLGWKLLAKVKFMIIRVFFLCYWSKCQKTIFFKKINNFKIWKITFLIKVGKKYYTSDLSNLLSPLYPPNPPTPIPWSSHPHHTDSPLIIPSCLVVFCQITYEKQKIYIFFKKSFPWKTLLKHHNTERYCPLKKLVHVSISYLSSRNYGHIPLFYPLYPSNSKSFSSEIPRNTSYWDSALNYRPRSCTKGTWFNISLIWYQIL